jgi:hypothetical protein
MVISSKLPARGYRVDERPPKRSALRCGFGFDTLDLTPVKLNRILMGASDWVHLGEIVVIHGGDGAAPAAKRL